MDSSLVMKLLTVFSLLLMLMAAVMSTMPQPEQIHISPTDKNDEMTVMWSTNIHLEETHVLYGLSKDALTQKAEGTSEILTNKVCLIDVFVWGFFCYDEKQQRVHTVTIKGLMPKTTYYYKVGSPFVWSKIFNFTTLPEGNDWPTKMIIFGDLGKDSPATPWLIKEANTGNWQAFFHNGDIAYNLESEGGKTGDVFLQQIQPISSQYPYLVSAGNHDTDSNFTNYKVRFRMPGNTDNMFYTYKIGKVLFVVISTEVFYEGKDRDLVKRNQIIWLENVLKEANEEENRKERPWIIVAGHRPMYCSTTIAEMCPNTYIQNEFEDLFIQYGVDLVFAGHEHDYERSYPIHRGTACGFDESVYLNPCAPIYIISGSAGNIRGQFMFLGYKPNYIAFRNQDISYTRLTAFNSTNLYMEQVSVDQEGEVIDKVLIRKDKL